MVGVWCIFRIIETEGRRTGVARLLLSLAGLWWAEVDAEVDAELTQQKLLIKLGLLFLLLSQIRKTSHLCFI